MSAIPCASVNVKTMADGTLRISFDVEPAHALAAFRLFHAPGTPAAIAALQVGYASAANIQNYPEKDIPEKPKGGALSKLAGVWCNDPEFWGWINNYSEGGDMCNVVNVDKASEWVRDICDIHSRAVLDHDEAAAERFNRLIRGPYMKYMLARGGNAK